MWFALKLRSTRDCVHRAAGASDVLELLGQGALMIDVREPAEFQLGHAPQARNIPLERLDAFLPSLPRSRALVLVCGSGFRSARAARLLAREGFDVVRLAGGMRAWGRSGLSVVPAPDHVRPGHPCRSRRRARMSSR